MNAATAREIGTMAEPLASDASHRLVPRGEGALSDYADPTVRQSGPPPHACTKEGECLAETFLQQTGFANAQFIIFHSRLCIHPHRA